jgi:hypothetical protein
MKRSRLITAVVAGMAFVGFFLWPSMYIYSEGEAGYVFRVNRFTGIKEVSSEYGWKTDKELLEIGMAEVKRERAQYRAKSAAFLEDARKGEIVEASWSGRELTVTYKDGRVDTALAAGTFGEDQELTKALMAANVRIWDMEGPGYVLTPAEYK